MKNKFRTYACLAGMIFALNFVANINVYAQEGRQYKYEIRSAFLYNFANYVTWPKDAFVDKQSPLIIGVLGEDPFGETLKSVEGEVAQHRRIVVKRFSTEKDIDICHILFISSSEKDRLKQLLNNGFSEKNILTVGSMAHFTQSGGVINFVVRNNKTKFEISRKSAERANLILSSELLKLAIITDQNNF